MVAFLTIGFFLHWGVHGFYMDDYTVKLWAFDLAANRWKPNFVPFHYYWRIRPIADILAPNLASAIPHHEFVLRLGIVAMHFLNVLLLVGLVHRVTGSMLLSTLSGTYFLFPVFGNEGLLFFTAAITDVFSLFFLLLGFHCFLSCRSLLMDWHRFLFGAAAWFLMVMFYESGLFTIVLLPAFVSLERRERQAEAYKIAISMLAVLGAYLFLVERSEPNVLSRGGLTLNLSFIFSRRVPYVSENFWWLVTDRGRLPGFRFASVSGPLREALRLGWHEWLSVPWGPIIIAIAILGICLMGLLLPVRRETPLEPFHLLKVAVIGCGWVVLGLTPIVFVKSQIVEIRTLYIPSVGFALAAAAFSTLVVRLFLPWRDGTIRALLLVAGVWVFLTSLTMAGLVRAYELRWDLDQKQVATLQPLVSKVPISEPLWLLPIGLDERSVSTYWGRNAALDAYLYSVFETPSSASDAVRLRFGRERVDAVTGNRWVKPRITAVQYSDDGRPANIVVEGTTVPIQELLAFTYHEGHAILLNPLYLESSDGSSIVTNLPLVEKLATAGVEIQPYHLQLEQMN